MGSFPKAQFRIGSCNQGEKGSSETTGWLYLLFVDPELGLVFADDEADERIGMPA